MTRLNLTCLLLLLASLAFGQPDLKLWYNQPAKVWTEALPLGNGRLGAMVFGRPENELIQLNEATLWSGGPVKHNVNPDAYKYLLQTREALLKEENYEKAAQLARKMQGVYSESFEPLGDVSIHEDFDNKPIAHYYRDLNISDAIATTRFTVDGIDYTRQMFISAPDQVIILHFTSSAKGKLNFSLNTKSQLKFQNGLLNSSTLAMRGKAPAHTDPNYVNYNKEHVVYNDSTHCRGMRFILLARAIGDGTVSVDTTGISVKNGSDVTVYLSAATSFNGFDKCPDKDGKDETAIAERYLSGAIKKGFSNILQDHLKDYHYFFNRVNFQLKDTTINGHQAEPTNERLLAYTDGGIDHGLETLYYQFGRYLLISCSRPGGPPANLQGIWNNSVRPPWSSNYTININTQMNYWPAEMANLAEMHEPMYGFIKDLSVTGRATAREFYHADGWMAHHNSDIWALSNPVGDMRGDPKWANWAVGSPWLCEDLWQHYQFSLDTAFLRNTAYPLMKGAAQFCLSWLVKDKDGYLVTAPALSPENDFIDDKGRHGSVSIATTMDMAIIRDLFDHVLAATDVLKTDKAFHELIASSRAKLYPFHIGKKGNLQEWYKDWEDVDPHHRHVSHLFALHPGTQISPLTTPQLAAAAKRTLELRGDEGTGWSLAWKINFWARLRDGDHAYKLLRDLLRAAEIKKTEGQPGHVGNGSGAYPNLFDAHPPFQIDGNFGGVAGMTEMLLQSQNGEIDLLPALPDAWSAGEIKGLRARGNVEVDIQWSNHRLTSAKLKPYSTGLVRIRSKQPIRVANVKTQHTETANGYLTTFTAVKGKTYEVTGN
jgi:alpha-L-fucosidase 2